jgi:hypothetical protein
LFSPGTPVFFTNKADPHVIAEILLKVVLKIMTIPLTLYLEKGKLLIICATWAVALHLVVK